MDINERQPAEAREIAETQDRVDLKRAAHKIFWKRMNGSIDAANPFADADSSSVASKETGATTKPSRHR